jgi:serine/threonine protein kinase
MSEPSWIGRTLGGRYQIEELLGEGGMSSVYKATDPNLRRTVAVKLIHPHLSKDPEFVSRFEEEAAAVAQLKHPNVIQVFDFDHDADTYYMVLEYIPGETLQERLKDLASTSNRLAEKETIEIVSRISGALHYAHGRGMIHRDVKPANIILDDRGHPILMDFGIAKIIGGKVHTGSSSYFGSSSHSVPSGELRPDSRGERAGFNHLLRFSDFTFRRWGLGIVLVLNGSRTRWRANYVPLDRSTRRLHRLHRHSLKRIQLRTLFPYGVRIWDGNGPDFGRQRRGSL